MAEKEGVKVRVMAGESLGAVGPIKMRNPGMLLDVRLAAGSRFQQPVPREWNGFCYCYDGAGSIGGTQCKAEQALVLGEGNTVEAETSNKDGLKFLLIAGQPIKEPIVQHGPFVMNTQEEIHQAFNDYQSGRFHDPNDNPWVDE